MGKTDTLSRYISSLLRKEFSMRKLPVTITVEDDDEQDCDADVRFVFKNGNESRIYLQVGFDYCLVSREIWNKDAYTGTKIEKHFGSREIYQTDGWIGQIQDLLEVAIPDTKPEVRYTAEGTMPDCTAGMLDIRSKADGACLVASGLEWQNEQGGDRCFHVQLVSWDESGKAHPLMKALMGRRIQLSIKTLD